MNLGAFSLVIFAVYGKNFFIKIPFISTPVRKCMNRYQLKLLLVFLCLFPGLISACDEKALRKRDLGFSQVPNVTEMLQPVLLNWTSQITDSWDSGAPKELLFFDPDGWPVKKILYYPSGMVFQEADLIDSSYGPEWKGTLHGSLWTFHEDGSVMRTETREKGLREGIERTFSDEGIVVEEREYQNDLPEGSQVFYFPSGQVSERMRYKKGVRSGLHEKFWEDGTKHYEASYDRGVLQGRSIEWWANGSVRYVCFWLHGLLHSYKGKHAFSSYSDQGKLVEQQDFIGGQPHGIHMRQHENGLLAMSVRFFHGKKEGTQDYYDPFGNHIGHREFLHGLSVGYHWKKESGGQLLMEGTFSAPGTGEIHFFDISCVKRSSFHVLDGKLSGEWLEWDGKGRLVKQLFYEKDAWNGLQKGFYPTGKLQFSFEYEKGMRHGLQEEWFPNEQKAARACYVKGSPHGLYESWYLNGTKRAQEPYKMGILDGSLFYWYENGARASSETWREGKREMKAFVWSPEGTLLAQEEWKNGLKEGVWKEWYETGKEKSMRSFLKGVPDGKEIEWSEDGQVTRLCFWKSGTLDGLSEEWDEDGSLLHRGSFIEGRPEGLHETMYEKEPESSSQAKMKEERFLDGQLHGRQVAYHPNGQMKLEAFYNKGILEGTKKAFHEGGEMLFSGTYKEGRLEGEVFHRRADGLEEIQCYKGNHPDGVWQLYYPSHPTFGKVKALEASFSNGLLHGDYIEYNQTGQMSFSVRYEHGLQEGNGCMYDLDGRILMTAEFHKGELEGPVRCFYPSGALLKEGIYVHGLLEGEEKRFHENGSLAQTAAYREGKLHGPMRSWNQKHQLIFEGEYKNGLRSGLFKKYEESGRLRIVQKFENDVLLERQEIQEE